MANQVVAVASNLPIADLETVREHYKVLAILSGKKVSVRFRGPRRKAPSGRTSFAGQLTCLKQDARAFSVYFV